MTSNRLLICYQCVQIIRPSYLLCITRYSSPKGLADSSFALFIYGISLVRGHIFNYSDNVVICKTKANWEIFTFYPMECSYGLNKNFNHARPHKAINTVLFIAENRPCAALIRHLLVLSTVPAQQAVLFL